MRFSAEFTVIENENLHVFQKNLVLFELYKRISVIAESFEVRSWETPL